MNRRQTAAVCLIGEELLSGKIDDLNGGYAIKQLRRVGVDLREVRMIGDEIPVIGSVVRSLAASYDIVFTSGGVGPTHDDLTMRGIAEAFDVPVQTHADMLALVRQRFGDRGDELRVWERMAELPKGCEILLSPATRVPIFQMRNVWVLPGIPELFRLQLDQIVRRLEGKPVSIRTIFLTVGEGEIAAHLENALVKVPSVKIGSYPVLHAQDHRTRVTIECVEPAHVEHALAYLLECFDPSWVVRVGDSHRINDPDA